MRIRKQPRGDRNIVGFRVEERRKSLGLRQNELIARLQRQGVSLNASGLSKLEGQLRFVADYELVALADALEVSVAYLLGQQTQTN